MKLNKSEQLFFGCKIDSKLREALAQAKPGERRYFEDPNSEFLRVMTIGEERWIGKVVGGGIGVNDVDDIQRNVISILRRIAPAIRTSPASIKIFACDGGAPADIGTGGDEEVEEEPTPGQSGPYIDY